MLLSSHSQHHCSCATPGTSSSPLTTLREWWSPSHGPILSPETCHPSIGHPEDDHGGGDIQYMDLSEIQY